MSEVRVQQVQQVPEKVALGLYRLGPRPLMLASFGNVRDAMTHELESLV